MGLVFIDVDDTLVLWLGDEGQPLAGQNPYGGGSERWQFNDELLAALEDTNHADIIVWSGGGDWYARDFRNRLGWERAGYMAKDIRVPRPQDVCIDDMPLNVVCPVMTWQEFVAKRATA